MCQGLICLTNELESAVVYGETSNVNYFAFKFILKSLSRVDHSTDLPTYSTHQVNVLWL